MFYTNTCSPVKFFGKWPVDVETATLGSWRERVAASGGDVRIVDAFRTIGATRLACPGEALAEACRGARSGPVHGREVSVLRDSPASAWGDFQGLSCVSSGRRDHRPNQGVTWKHGREEADRRDAQAEAGRSDAGASEGHEDGIAYAPSGVRSTRQTQRQEAEVLGADVFLGGLIDLRGRSDLSLDRPPERRSQVSLFLPVVLQRPSGLLSRDDELDIKLFRDVRFTFQQLRNLVGRRSAQPVLGESLGGSLQTAGRAPRWWSEGGSRSGREPSTPESVRRAEPCRRPSAGS
jgi:hypothetical protein